MFPASQRHLMSNVPAKDALKAASDWRAVFPAAAGSVGQPTLGILSARHPTFKSLGQD
jgi:hypothetical protein